MISLKIDRTGDETIVRATVANRGDGPIRLDFAIFRVATGISEHRPARFFKHGYQSWSPSGPARVGTAQPHRLDSAPELMRLCHQSEITRPPSAAEAATSELFTIIEGEGDRQRTLAGFVGTASQLTAITVASAGEIAARVMFDGVTLLPAAEREIEPLLLIRADQSAARLAARWASRAGRAMKARTAAAYQRGWCSWYHYFHAISEDALRSNIRALAAMRDDFPLELIQLDDGFQSALGDWDTTNPEFPSGLRRVAEEIRRAGFEAGIWTAPFFAARDSRIMSAHPDWFIRDQSGAPLKAGYNANWTAHEDAFAYALDASNPAFATHLSRLYEKIVVEFGYSYLKLDFLYAGAAEGLRHDPNLTRAEVLRRGLEAIRAGAGDRTFILGCGCPLGPAIGVVDGMRIGPDVAPAWGTGTRQAIDAIIARSFMHRQLWLNDPDCMMLRDEETSLSREERGALASVIAASGEMLLLSDDMNLLGPRAGAAFKSAASLGAEVDRDSAREPALAADLMADGPIRVLRKELPNGALAMILNRGEEVEPVTLADHLGSGRFRIIALGDGENDSPDTLDLPPHSARLVRVRR